MYLLPNLLTTAGLFAGFYAIVAAMGNHFGPAAIAIFVAMLMDGLDGRVARLTNTQSDFGVQYDSLSDLVCFGLAPSLVIYEWALRDMSGFGWAWAKLGWLAAFIYAAGAALRLARFNTQVGTADKRYFQGLPSPSAAAVLAGLVWVGSDMGVPGADMIVPGFVLTSDDPPKVLFSVFLIYALSGPVLTLSGLRKRRRERANRSGGGQG
ncbi:MAG: CDP-alcohol phosphatidyltransferase family protein [Gammaproteobacteria bacterium]